MDEVSGTMSHEDFAKAMEDWLKDYTWIQEDGSVDTSKPRDRPEGLAIDRRERECPDGCLEVWDCEVLSRG